MDTFSKLKFLHNQRCDLCNMVRFKSYNEWYAGLSNIPSMSYFDRRYIGIKKLLLNRNEIIEENMKIYFPMVYKSPSEKNHMWCLLT